MNNPNKPVKPTQWTTDGYWQAARQVHSPNQDQRPVDAVVSLIVIHNISLPPNEFGGPGVEQLFTNTLNPDEHPYYRDIAKVEVSAHFLIRRAGEVIQFVSCDQRAWHAGQSSWNGQQRCNEFSIGIELEGSDFVPFEPAQYAALSQLISAMIEHYPITAVVGHEHIAPGRKTDPGPCFDWSEVNSLCAANGISQCGPKTDN